jgi:hypothetical protein
LIRISELTLEIEEGEEPFNSELEAAAVSLIRLIGEHLRRFERLSGIQGFMIGLR